MHAASLAWCGINEFPFAPVRFTMFELWFWLFFRDDAADFRRRWKNTGSRFAAPAVTLSAWMRLCVCALRRLVYGAKHRDLTLRIFFYYLFYFFPFLTADGRADIAKSMFALRLEKNEGAQPWFSGCFGVHRDQNGKISFFSCLSLLLVCAEAFYAFTFSFFFLWTKGALSAVLKPLFRALLKLIRL